MHFLGADRMFGGAVGLDRSFLITGSALAHCSLMFCDLAPDYRVIADVSHPDVGISSVTKTH